MINQNAIIVLIDVEAALNANTLQGHSFLIDNYRFKGSTGQGSEQLCTAVIGSQILNWLITGLDFSGVQPTPALENIGGEAVDKQIMVPQLFDSPSLVNLGLWWGATVDANAAGKYNYTLFIDIGGTKMELVSSINVQPGFTMETPLAQASARLGVTSLKSRSLAQSSILERTTADGSILNPSNHVPLFPKDLADKMRAVRNNFNR